MVPLSLIRRKRNIPLYQQRPETSINPRFVAVRLADCRPLFEGEMHNFDPDVVASKSNVNDLQITAEFPALIMQMAAIIKLP